MYRLHSRLNNLVANSRINKFIRFFHLFSFSFSPFPSSIPSWTGVIKTKDTLKLKYIQLAPTCLLSVPPLLLLLKVYSPLICIIYTNKWHVSLKIRTKRHGCFVLLLNCHKDPQQIKQLVKEKPRLCLAGISCLMLICFLTRPVTDHLPHLSKRLVNRYLNKILFVPRVWSRTAPTPCWIKHFLLLLSKEPVSTN